MASHSALSWLIRLSAVAAVLCAAAASAQSESEPSDQRPTFRGGVSSVLVDTLVLDEDGQPVAGLTADDFEVREDGVPQTITTFDVTDWTSYVSDQTGETATTSNASVNTYPRRFIFVVNRQVAEFRYLNRAKRALASFVVDSMAEGDEAMVIDIGLSPKVLQQFTASKQETLQTIQKMTIMRMDYPMGPDRAAGQIFRFFADLGSSLLELPGRKIMVFLSMELATFPTPGSRLTNQGAELEQAVQALNQSNTSVYTIDLRGVESRNTALAGGLSPLATETGGRYSRNSTSFETPLARIGRENQRYYLLSYVSTNPEMDGRYREIEVSLPGRDDVDVIARHGYFAREDDISVTDSGAEEDVKSVGDVSRAPAPKESTPVVSADIPAAVEMSTYILPTGSENASVLVSVALPRQLLSDGGSDPERLTLTISEGDHLRHSLEESVSASRTYVRRRVELPAGLYLIQMTLFSGTQQLYQASTGLQVPTDYGQRFGLSGIVPVVSPQAVEDVGDGELPILPSSSLRQGEDAYILFHVFAGRNDPSQRVYLSYSIFNDEREIFAGQKDESIELIDRPDGTPVILSLPLSQEEPGLYRIDVRVEDRSLNRRAGSEIQLEVR